MFSPIQRALSPIPGRSIPNPFVIFSPKNFEDTEAKKKKLVSEPIPVNSDSIYVILADDDADDRELFVEAIEDSGLNVKIRCAEDGSDLLSILKKQDAELPDLIFLDLNMPSVNGKECLQEIRSSDRLQNIPVIIYSTSSSINDIDETFDKGANLYVKKPSSFSDLLTITRQVLTLNWDKYKPKASRSNFVFFRKT